MNQARPLVPWIGGKRRLAAKLLALFPEHTTYVEAFAGGAAVLFARPEPAKVEVLNDVNGDLIRLYRCVQHHLDEFVRQFRWALNSRQMFKWVQLQHPDTLTDIQRAARFFYLQKLAFGGKVDGQQFGIAVTRPPRLNLLRLEEDLSAAHVRLSSVYVENLDWAECIRRYDRPETLVLLDPPYWQTEGYGVDFGPDQYQQLAEMMATLKGKAVLTINDHPEMKRVFGAFEHTSMDIQYTVGGSGSAPKTRELVYRSWLPSRASRKPTVRQS